MPQLPLILLKPACGVPRRAFPQGSAELHHVNEIVQIRDVWWLAERGGQSVFVSRLESHAPRNP